MFVFFVPQAYVPLMLFDGGYSNQIGAMVVSVYSAIMACGRIVGGLLADRVGEINMFTLATFVPIVCTLIWWVRQAERAQKNRRSDSSRSRARLG
jgi:nitrate/nitrite transporter NarK